MLDPYDISELKLRKPGDVLREIPDSYYGKPFIPMCDNLLTALRLADSWKDYKGPMSDRQGLEEAFANTIENRMQESFEISKVVEQGKISKERQQQTMCFWGYPPLLPIRMDMQGLSTTMIYGPSVDISFVGISDEDRDIFFIFNLHVEESVPVSSSRKRKILIPAEPIKKMKYKKRNRALNLSVHGFSNAACGFFADLGNEFELLAVSIYTFLHC